MSDAVRVPHAVRRAVTAIGIAEALSLVVLFGNLATVHVGALAQAVGPLHGLLYLAGIALVWSNPYPGPSRWLALLPGVGVWLAGRRR